MTETFIFSVAVAVVTISIPWFVAHHWDSWGTPGTGDAPVVKAAEQVFTKATEMLVDNPTPAGRKPDRPVPYIKQLPELYPYIRSYVKPFLISLPFAVAKFIFLLFWKPLSYVLFVIAKILAPVWVLCQVVFEILIRIPWNVLVWLSGILYPIYVFCGVAALVGGLLGLLGVGMGKFGLSLVALEQSDTDDAPVVIAEDRKGKGREIPLRKPTIKVEDGPRRSRPVD